MRSSMFFVAFLVVMTIAFTAGCGGGGQGFRIPNDPLVITSSTLPTMVSGEFVDHVIPLSGGCGGPYVVEVIAGTLPNGVGTIQGTEHKLEGFILEDGIFNFTIKVTDTTCVPFFTTTQAYVWDIQQGPVAIVAANPAIILNADYDDLQKHAGVDALETVVFSQFVVIDLIAAGGQGPYTCSVVDDPNDPLDGALPLGVSMAPSSCSIIGSPVQVLPGGIPFLMTIEVEDAAGNKATRKFQWKIDTPPLILSNASLVDGKAGTSYSDSIQIVDGVPPFAYELTDNAPGDDPNNDNGVNDDIEYVAGMLPTILTWELAGRDFQLLSTGKADSGARLERSGGRVPYPAENDDGAGASFEYSPMPSEGIYFRETGPGSGSFFGVPRRRGTFKVYVHAYSTLVPNEKGQHVFKGLSHTIAPSEPPAGLNAAFEMDPSFTVGGLFPALPALASLAEAEVTVLYNPDIGSHPTNGLKLKSVGGVVFDGWVDSPHEANRLPDNNELVGEHQWAFNELTPLPGMSLFPNSDSPIFGTETSPGDTGALVRSAARPMELTVSDLQLPLSVRASDTTVTRQFNIAVGPDVVIITESAQSFTGTSTTGSGDTNMHDRSMKVKQHEVLGGTGFVAPLEDGNNSAMQSVPALAGLGGVVDEIGQLLSGVAPGDPTLDLLRITVNPGGWWNDVGNMNPKGARSSADGDKSIGRTYYQANGYSNSGGGWHQSTASTLLPSTPSIVHDPASGIYSDGGKLYAFSSASRFGFFIIRNDASIYVPFATERLPGGMQKFADGIVDSATNSSLQMVPLAVSPDGRFAVAKVTRNTGVDLDALSRTSEGQFILFSLTGEKFSGGETYQIIDPDTGNGTYLFSTSMVMTDRGLFFLQGNYAATYGSWRDHYIHTYDYRDAGGALIPDGGPADAQAQAGLAGGGTGWTQSPGTPMQTPFQKWESPAAGRRNTSFATGGLTFIVTPPFTPQQEMYVYDGWNMGENSSAPVPFRVSADGKHCGLLAGPRSLGTSGTDVMSHYAWVASNGGDFLRASGTARHSPTGASRGYTLRRGPNSYYHWGRWSGPSTGFEIADDGSAVAFVYNRRGSISSTSTSNWNGARDDLIVVKGTAGGLTPFATTSEREVTAGIFGGAIIWRFGSLVFTKDNDGLIFWGGASAFNATGTSNSTSTSSTSTSTSMTYLGTYYAYNLNVLNQVKGVLPTSAGGVGNFPTYSSAVKFQPTTPRWTLNMGSVQPLGGFISRNRDYFYVTTNHPISGTDQSPLSMLGINIEDLANTGTGSGNTTGRGFKLGNHPSRRGFLSSYHYELRYALDLAYFNPAHTQGGGMQRMHKDTGTVYWMSHYQSSGPTTGTFSATWPVGPAVASNWRDEGYRGFHMEGFNADVGGPVARLTHAGLGSDTANRSGHFFTISGDGSKVAYVYQNNSSTRRHNAEKIGMVTHVGFDAVTGAADPDMDNGDADKAFVAESSGGRAGETMAFSSTGARLYYAFKVGASNENLRALVQYSIGNASPKLPTGTSRFNILHAGRR